MQQKGPHGKWQRLAAVGFGLALGACGTRTTGGEAADVGVTDAAVDEVVDEVDGTDGDLADVPDVIDTDNGDVPYWVAHDTDLSGLGVITDDGFCSNVYLKVAPDDPPHEPACASACPAPYPCTCGACPWIETPMMNEPRYDAKAIWAGQEVQIFGTDYMASIPLRTFSAERWNPNKDAGFSYINLPFAQTYTDYVGLHELGDFVPIWTGKQTFVFMRDQQFLVDPQTGNVTMLPLSPVTTAGGGTTQAFWVGDRVIVWGADRATYQSSDWNPRIGSWRENGGWEDVPPPPQFLVAPGPSGCMAVLDGALYALFFLPKDIAPNSGLDPAKPVMVRYDIPAKTWTALPQTMASDIRCDNGKLVFESFPDGILFIPRIGDFADGATHPPVGEIWWKSTGSWTKIHPPLIRGPISDAPFALWTGSKFIIGGASFEDPVTSGKLLPDASGVDGPTWPIGYDPYSDEFSYLTSVGYPKHYRLDAAAVFTGDQLIMQGGANGITETTFHRDGVRLWLTKP